MKAKFTAVFQREDDWWIAHVREVPGANTQGRTLEEARENLREALQLMLEENRKYAQSEFESQGALVEEVSVEG